MWSQQIGNQGGYFTNSISYDKWSLGLYSKCYNWSVYSDYMGSNTWQPLRTGLASLSLTWDKPLEKEITLIQLDEVPSTMTIDHNRVVAISYVA